MNQGDDFDPLGGVMIAQSSRPAELKAVNLHVLTPFHRALLALDGTVTKLIEAYTMEPLDIVRIAQDQRPLSEDHHWLESPKNTETALRQVVIRGRYSSTFYAYAVSMLVLDRLPERIRYGIEVQGEGIGRLLNDTILETRREVLWYGMEHLDTLPDGVPPSLRGDFISRTYRIITQGLPIALITEKFPSIPDGVTS